MPLDESTIESRGIDGAEYGEQARPSESEMV